MIDIHAKLCGKHYQIRSDDKIFLGYISVYVTYIVIPDIEVNIHLPVSLLSNYYLKLVYAISSVQSLSHVWLFATPWIAALQASLSISNSQSSLKLTSIESVMPSSPLILCRPLFLLPPVQEITKFSYQINFHQIFTAIFKLFL